MSTHHRLSSLLQAKYIHKKKKKRRRWVGWGGGGRTGERKTPKDDRSPQGQDKKRRPVPYLRGVIVAPVSPPTKPPRFMSSSSTASPSTKPPRVIVLSSTETSPRLQVVRLGQYCLTIDTEHKARHRSSRRRSRSRRLSS